ncbi:YfiR family protein [Massilia sp. TN1-12]|uniref:YfiR family protein n=1 Tax=Massilia paldalensis TaxID=3377675 RepID=UPI00384CE629
MHRQLKPFANRDLRRRMAVCLLACLAVPLGLAMMAPSAAAQSAIANIQLQRRVKAAFLVKFLGYVDFPAGAFGGPAAPVTIGVIDADDLVGELERAVAGRTIDGRHIAVRRLREGEGAPVHLLFVGGRDPVRVGQVVRQAAGAMLVVTECENGLRQGSAINFRLVDERVRFDVALEAAERNGVKLSSRLLTVASRVQKGAQ